ITRRSRSSWPCAASISPPSPSRAATSPWTPARRSRASWSTGGRTRSASSRLWARPWHGRSPRARFPTFTRSARWSPCSARLAAIVENSDDAIVSKSLDGIITSWNPAAERMFGWTRAEAVGRHITLIIPRERGAEEDEVLSLIRRGEMVDHFDTVRITKDGRLLNISLTVSAIRDSEGRIVGASKIARDVTEKKRLEAELSG